MQIKFASLPVTDQDKALRFYTEVVGLQAAADIDMGEIRFLSVCGEDGIEGAQIILGTTEFAPLATYQKAAFDADMPVLALNTDDVHRDYAALKANGVAFRGEPQDLGLIISVVFDDTVGNLVHLVQAKPM